MNNFIMLCGLPASGKSALTGRFVADGYKVFSSDEYRGKLLGDVNAQDDNNLVFTTMHKDIEECMKTGQDLVYDACNISAKRRKAYLETIKKYDYIKTCIVVATTYEKCLERNRLREREIPELVIKRMYESFHAPYYNEGWDEVVINYTDFDEEGETFSDFFAVDMPQENSNHTLTLLEHCKKCGLLALEKSKNYKLYEAGLLHDNGKVFTKVFHNSKGEPTTEAHYYNHQFVGAYNSLFYLKNEWREAQTILYVANLIQYHMQPYFIQTEKAKQKFIKLVGEDMYKDIMILHEADKEAH